MIRTAQTLATALSFFVVLCSRADPGPMVLFSTNAAANWVMDASPIGNGKLAAMIFGGVASDQIQFNEDTIWIGQPRDYSHPNAYTNLAYMQSNVFNLSTSGQTAFWNRCLTNFMSIPIRQAAYQPAGILNLAVPHSGLSNYKRALDLNTATVNVTYDYSGTSYNRDYFASAPSNKVIIIRLTASQSAKITFTATFSTLQSATMSTVGNDLVMHAHVVNGGDPRYYANNYNTTLSGITPASNTNAIFYDARLRVVAEGGTVTTTSTSISVTNADAVTLLLAVASNFINYNDVSANYALICSNNIAAAASVGYTTLRQAQQNDFQSLFNRVVLDLGGNSKTNLPTYYRKRQIGVDGDDPQLVALLFQLGRYLMISGSRPGSQPLNLQGKWNDITAPSWDSKMTLNINEEMNYWGAEVANLSECHQPLFDLIADLSVSGARVAKTNYNADGWTAHHNTDLWRGAAPVNGQDGVWPTGGAWLCQHLWTHYQFTGDTNWLATNAYPLMKGAAQFFEDYLIPHKTNANWLVTNPSYSPEHDFNNSIPNVAGPTMDNELLRDLFKHVIEASQILGVDATFRSNITIIRDKLPPNQVGPTGYLQEWLQPYDDPGHRHCSHLVGLMPGDEISPFYTPTIAAAARISVLNRGTGTSGAGRIGWGEAWRLNLRDRLLDGESAFLCLTNLIVDSKFSTNTLVFHDNPNRQIDAVFGTMNGIAEMFLQSQLGEVFLLPALPSAFTNGSVTGLCARGGFQVDINWQSNKLVSANVFSKLGNICRIRSKCPIDVKLGSNFVNAPMILPGLLEFSTVAGSNYTILAANVAETENLSATTSGDTHQVTTNTAFSNWRGTRLNANAAADYVSYTVTNITAGTYRLVVAANAGTNCARFQLSGGPGGALTNVGSVQDTYSATNMVYVLPTNSITTNFLWTNMLTEFDCGNWTAPTNGDYEFKFTVVDKNASSSGYTLAFDHIKLTQLSIIVPPNQPPTDISLSNSSVTENKPGGTTVGTLSTTDPDAGNTFTYTLVTGAGDTDNASFSIGGSTLQTAASFNYEAQNSFSVRVRSADQEGLFVEKAFTISVVNTNETPTDISLSNSSVTENQSSGTAVGTLSATDPDAGNSFTYTLVSGVGSADNGSFSISGSTLQTAASFNYEAQSSYSVRIRSTDQGGLFFEKLFTVSVTDTNESPTDISLSNSLVTENEPSGTAVGTLGTTDPDSGNTFTYALAGGTGSADNGSFTLSGNTLQTAASFNYEAQNSYSIRLRSTDQSGLSHEKVFAVSVVNTNETPTDIALSNDTVGENLPVGTPVGTFGTSDPDIGNTFAYTLVSGAGSADNGSFGISSNKLQTAAVFDYETQSNYTVRVRSADQGGLFHEKAFAIIVDTNTMPAMPINLAPADGSAVPALTPMLRASAFDNPSSVAGHMASQWLIRRSSDSALVFDSGENTANKTNVVVPGGILEMATLYNWQTRYGDSNTVWSAYSTATFFSTPGPALSVGKLENQIVIFWPTNPPGFSLELTHELPSTNWLPATPPPVVVDGQNVVTNPIQPVGTNFYRLKK